ncbi:Nitrogen permease regulator 3, partial [Coemansia sp. RSA 1694]
MDSGNAILGVFLATYSSKGDYLPLRYPTTRHAYECAEVLLRRAAAHRHEAAAEQARAGDGADDAGSDTNAASAAAGFMRGTYKDAPSRVGSYTSVGNANTAASVPDEGARLLEPGLEGPSERHPKMDDKIRGFDPSFLAQLFSPRPSMSDQRFQVAIDNVLFVGHPLRDDPNEKTLDPDYYDAEQDDAETMSRLASLTECDGWQVKSDIMLNRGANPQATKLLADLGLVNLVLNREPSEAGDSAISAGEREVRDSREWKRRGYRKRVYPRLFHVVFMLDNTAPGVETVADRLYEHVLLRLTKTLMIEQMEANYVLTQSRLMRSLNDQAHAERYSTARYLHEALRRSTLAADLIELFNGLHRGELVSLHVRKRVMLSLQIPRGPPLARAPPPARPRLLFSTDAKHCASAGASAAYGGSGAT